MQCAAASPVNITENISILSFGCFELKHLLVTKKEFQKITKVSLLRTSDVFKSSLSFRRFSKSFLNSEILLERFIFSDSRFSKHCMNPNLSSSFALSSDSSSPSRKRRISCNQKQYRFETCFKIRFRFNKIYSQSSNAPHFIKKERIISLIFK